MVAVGVVTAAEAAVAALAAVAAGVGVEVAGGSEPSRVMV